MIQRVFQHSCLYPYIDLALLDLHTKKDGLESKVLRWNESPKKVIPLLLEANVLYIHPNGFDKWTDILMEISKKRSLPVRLMIIAGSDFALGDEHMEAVVAFFPNTEFWIHNWCGRSERCFLLPLGANGQPEELLTKSKNIGISFLLNYIGNQKREEFFKFLDENPSILQYCLPKGGLQDYYRYLSTCYFSLAPMGEGFDTYRFWESLMVGAIPVVKDHEFYQDIEYHYPCVPMILLKDWNELLYIEENLTSKLQEKMMAGSKLECLTEAYWVGRVKKILEGAGKN